MVEWSRASYFNNVLGSCSRAIDRWLIHTLLWIKDEALYRLCRRVPRITRLMNEISKLYKEGGQNGSPANWLKKKQNKVEKTEKNFLS